MKVPIINLVLLYTVISVVSSVTIPILNVDKSSLLTIRSPSVRALKVGFKPAPSNQDILNLQKRFHDEIGRPYKEGAQYAWTDQWVVFPAVNHPAHMYSTLEFPNLAEARQWFDGIRKEEQYA